MKRTDVRPQTYVKELECEKCGMTAQDGEVEFSEFTSVDFTAGYGSIFGNGNRVAIDLCQNCLKAVLGPWLRVIEPSKTVQESTLAQMIERFDANKHGSEFAALADAAKGAADEVLDGDWDAEVERRLSEVDQELDVTMPADVVFTEAERYQAVLQAAQGLLGQKGGEEYMSTPNFALGGRKPVDLLDSDAGESQVLNELDTQANGGPM